MLNEQHRIPLIDKIMKDMQKSGDIRIKQACRRFVEQIQRITAETFAQFLCELDALSLAAAERERRLAEMDVT